MELNIKIYLKYACVSIALFSSSAYSDSNWIPIRDVDLEILPGSALDFSFLVKDQPTPPFSRLITQSDGHLYFENDKKNNVRLFCASQPHGTLGGFPEKDIALKYARQLKLHGYNAVRFYFIDSILMRHGKHDFDFSKEQFDKFLFFLSALKNEGIYWILDGMTSWNGANYLPTSNRWIKTYNVKAGIYYDHDQKEHWKKLVKELLTRHNPYTKKRIIDDPALAGLILVNEGGLNFVVHLEESEDLNSIFRNWLVKKYSSLDQLEHAWKEKFTSFNEIKLPRKIWSPSRKMADTQRFYFEQQLATFDWMSSYVKEIGYKGLITSYNNWPHLQDDATRAHIPWVDMHFYHDAPSDFSKPGSRIKQTSSLSGYLTYLQKASASRHWGKPYSLSEHDQPFWNKWRFESGLAVGAIASFQNWDMVCRHTSSAIELRYWNKDTSRQEAIHPYGGGMDPIVRASETLSALLYSRGDVSTSNNNIGIKLTEEYVFGKKAGIEKLPKELTKLALSDGLGLIWEPNAERSLFPYKDLAIRDAANVKYSMHNRVNIFHSNTGEITLQENRLDVITEKTEAIALHENSATLKRLQINKATSPALISISSLEDSSLINSDRMLLIIATDAKNSGMEFHDENETTLKSLGKLPILLKPISVEITLNHARASKLTLYALKLNGERSEKIETHKVNKNKVQFTIDTASLNYGPTTFFELTTDTHSTKNVDSFREF